MQPRRSGLTMVAVAGVIALGALGVLAVRSSRRSPVATTPAQPAPTEEKVVPDPDPTFSTKEQAATYYGAVVTGEKRALDVVEAAIKKAKAEGGDRAHVARLESLRAGYQERLQRHQAKLSLR
jgi:hypothetical protein